jgi:hypothetical protein
MKALFFVITASLCGCAMEKQVQVKIVDVELVKVETVYRLPNYQEKILTWKDDNNVQYVSFEPANSNSNIGARMKMLIRR